MEMQEIIKRMLGLGEMDSKEALEEAIKKCFEKEVVLKSLKEKDARFEEDGYTSFNYTKFEWVDYTGQDGYHVAYTEDEELVIQFEIDRNEVVKACPREGIEWVDVEKTIKNLIGLVVDDDDDIRMAFDTTNESIILTSPDRMNGFSGDDGIHYASEELNYSIVITFEMEDGKIIDAWV